MNPAVDLIIGILPHRAGVEQHNIRFAFRLSKIKAALAQHRAHDLGVVDIHLAAVGLDKNLFHCKSILEYND